MKMLGKKPIFLLHQSYHNQDMLFELFSDIRSSTPNNIAHGIVINLPYRKQNRQQRFLEPFHPVADIILADPAIHLHNDYADRKRQRLHYRYMESRVPDTPTNDWIKSIIKIQNQLNVTHVLAPARPLGLSAKPSADLDWQVEAIMRTAHISDKPVLGTFTLTHDWLQNDNFRAMLLNEITDLNIDAFYIRVEWPIMTPPLGQLNVKSLLKGYKELCQICERDSINLVLPTTSLTGWFMLPFGATGFSMGLSSSEYAFAKRPRIRRPKGRPSVGRRNRYFSKPLLHVVDLTYHQSLLGIEGYDACDCKYCSRIGASDSELDHDTWNHTLASAHYVLSVASLTEDLLSSPHVTSTLRSNITKRRSFLKKLSALSRPIGDNHPRPLKVWENVLR